MVTDLGLLSVAATLEEHTVRLIVDTGASHTVIDRRTAERLALQSRPGSDKTYTYQVLGDAAPVLVGMTLRVGDIVLRDRPIPVVDLAFMNTALTSAGSLATDGILGVDVLHECNARIDFAQPTLHLEQPYADSSSSDTT